MDWPPYGDREGVQGIVGDVWFIYTPGLKVMLLEGTWYTVSLKTKIHLYLNEKCSLILWGLIVPF